MRFTEVGFKVQLVFTDVLELRSEVGNIFTVIARSEETNDYILEMYGIPVEVPIYCCVRLDDDMLPMNDYEVIM